MVVRSEDWMRGCVFEESLIGILQPLELLFGDLGGVVVGHENRRRRRGRGVSRGIES